MAEKEITVGLFILVRHGQTAGNRDKIYRGRWDLPLDEDGLDQVERAGRALGSLHLDAIYTSPLLRTRQTAEAVARHQAVEPVVEEGLLDIDYGQWTRQPDERIAREQARLYRLWHARPQEVVFPRGEGLAQVRRRVEDMFVRLAPRHAAETVALVGHRVSVKMMLLVALGLDDSAFWKVQVDTASLSALRHHDDGWQLLFANETCHLKELGERLRPVDF